MGSEGLALAWGGIYIIVSRGSSSFYVSDQYKHFCSMPCSSPKPAAQWTRWTLTAASSDTYHVRIIYAYLKCSSCQRMTGGRLTLGSDLASVKAFISLRLMDIQALIKHFILLIFAGEELFIWRHA
jgi:hypothetical protein